MCFLVLEHATITDCMLMRTLAVILAPVWLLPLRIIEFFSWHYWHPNR